MADWRNCAGANGEYEPKFIQERRIHCTWDKLNKDLSKLPTREALLALLQDVYPENKPATLKNWLHQIWPFAKEMQKGDLVILPFKLHQGISAGKITGDYHFKPQSPKPYFHWRPVTWPAKAIPRASFGKDLLFTFGAFWTICRIQRNNAEPRLSQMRLNGAKPELMSSIVPVSADTPEPEQVAETDVERIGLDQITQTISARFKGHGLARLVDAVLKAEGYTTHMSPEGPDGGVDILAGAGPLDFGRPRLCVQAKSEDSPIDHSTVDRLIGTVSKYNEDGGLCVSGSCIKTNVHRDLAGSFFRVRLWSRDDLLDRIFLLYDKLDDQLKAELPLKQFWTVAATEQ